MFWCFESVWASQIQIPQKFRNVQLRGMVPLSGGAEAFTCDVWAESGDVMSARENVKSHVD